MAEAVDEAAVTVKGGKRDIVKVRNLFLFHLIMHIHTCTCMLAGKIIEIVINTYSTNHTCMCACVQCTGLCRCTGVVWFEPVKHTEPYYTFRLRDMCLIAETTCGEHCITGYFNIDWNSDHFHLLANE